MAIDVFYKQTNTSIYLHALFGSVVGILNPELFQKLIDILASFKGKQ